MPENVLYLVVLPLIKIPRELNVFRLRARLSDVGSAEQMLTLFPDKNFATQFYPDEVESYIQAFLSAETSLTGGHVIGYEVVQEPGDDGRVIVRVVQHVG